ncbi:MAG: DUF1501 domain-containing protein [Planctomycetes bacterium]|nr:DUF1501 domain-containing protein [Planctomycetota bacterium]
MSKLVNVSRRDFLRTSAAGGLVITSSFLGANTLLAEPSAKATGTKKCKQVILLWMEGGPSQFETFDPKPGKKTGAPYKALETEVPGFTPCETFPKIAAAAKDICLIKSMTSKEGNHSRGAYYMHTGYIPNPTLKHPSLGSIVGHQLGKPDFDLPNFVKLRGAPFPAGYLGVENNPFVIANPGARIENLDYAKGVDKARMEKRMKLVEEMEKDFAKSRGSDATDAHKAMYDKARKLMDSPLKAKFYIDDEPQEVRDAYGKGKFAESCIIARRLIEAGVACVEVVQGGWDTHDDGFVRCKQLASEIDQPWAALLADLKKRGLLDTTLVVWMGEFGRTPQVTDTEGRGHWPGNFCVAMSGGGVKTGQVIGETDEMGEKIVKDPVRPQDLYWTFASLMGWDTTREFEAGPRPVWLVDIDKKLDAKPVEKVMK